MKVIIFLSSVLLTVHLGRTVEVGSCPALNGDVDVLLADDQNCSVFYKCNWGDPIALSCPDGLFFNVETNQCDWPVNVNCVPSSSGSENNVIVSNPLFDCPPVESLFIPDRDNCSKYYVCVSGQAIEMACPFGLLYDGLRWSCNFPLDVICGAFAPPESVPGATVANRVARSVIANPETGPVIDCPIDSLYATYIPDKSNCSIYYKCNFGVPIMMECPLGLSYDGIIWACNFPELTTCGVFAPMEMPTTATIPVETETPISITATGPVEPCPADSSKYPVLLPDATDCSIYYVCEQGNPLMMACPEGLQYDGITWACNFPRDVVCGQYLPRNFETTEVAQTSTTGKPIDNLWVGDCPVPVADVTVFLTSQVDPTQFYVCVGMTPVQMQCPANLVFNLELQQCDYP